MGKQKWKEHGREKTRVRQKDSDGVWVETNLCVTAGWGFYQFPGEEEPKLISQMCERACV